MAKVEIEDTELADLRKAAAAATKATARAEALEGQLTEARKGESRLKELEAMTATLQAEKLDAVYQGAGVSDAKIRRVFELEWEEVSQAEGGPKDLATWLGELKADPAKAPAHLAPFLGAAAPAAGKGGPAGGQRAPLPNANKGAGPGPGADTGTFSAEQIEKMTPAELAAALPAITQQYPELAAFASAFGKPPETHA